MSPWSDSRWRNHFRGAGNQPIRVLVFRYQVSLLQGVWVLEGHATSCSLAKEKVASSHAKSAWLNQTKRNSDPRMVTNKPGWKSILSEYWKTTGKNSQMHLHSTNQPRLLVIVCIVSGLNRLYTNLGFVLFLELYFSSTLLRAKQWSGNSYAQLNI